MLALRVLLVMVLMSPVRSERDYAFRWALAESIATVAPSDEHLQDELATIAWLESAFRRSVARCDVRGDRGRSLGVYQIQPIERGDDKRACSTDLIEQSRLARRYVERSAAACPDNEGPDTLSMYVSGTCAKGLPQARHRWEPPARASVVQPKPSPASPGFRPWEEPSDVR